MADRWMPDLEEKEGLAFASGEAYEELAEKFRNIFDPSVEFTFTEEDAKELFINTSISDYVWLPLRFENDMVYIDWKDEWRTEDYQ